MRRPSTAQKTVVFTALVAVVAGAMIVSRPLSPSDSRQPDQSANYFWTEAVLHSLPIEDADYTAAVRFYAQAISHSQTPSNIYIAWGDYLRGPMPISEFFTNVTEDEEKLAEAVKHPEKLDPM